MSTTANETMSVSTTGFFCELCKLDFTTKEELKEHCWSILHHGKLNKAKGRDCVHECSLCNETFTELLSFTKHLHGDAHQDRYNTWKKEQVNHWQSRNYSPITTTSTTQKDFLTNSNGNRASGHNDKACQGSFWERPHWQNTRFRNRNRKTRHNDQEAVPVRLHTFRIENSGTITELGHDNEHSEINFNIEEESSFNDFKGTRRRYPSRNDFYQASERPNTRNWAQSNKARGDALGKSHKGRHKSYHKSHKQRNPSAKRHNNSRGSSTSFDKSVSSLDDGLSSSMDRTRSSTTGLGVSTRTCSSEFMNSQTGKGDRSSAPFELKTVQNSPGNEENRTRSLRNRSKYTWMSDSYRATLNNDGLFSNNQLYTDFTTTSSKPNEQKLKSDGSGPSHSIVGNGADDTEVFTLKEATGHDNGNPGDSNAEIVSNNSNSDQSKLETTERVPFVSKRRTRSSYAKGNAKDFDMTMDKETGSKTRHYLSSDTSKHSTTSESKSTNAKLTKEPKINTRLRSRSSSDDSTLLSRQNTVRSSTNSVTQYQSLHRPGGLGSLEFTSSNLALKETKSKETPSQNGDKDSHKLLAKIKTEGSDSALMNVDSGTVSKIIEEQQNSGGEAESNTECSFVHIDGVQCTAKTSERYCSYHKKFPQGNLIKTEPQDTNPTLSSLDLSSTTVNPDTSMSFNSGYPRMKNGYERNPSPEKNVEMMDLSMSTNFLSVAHSHMRKPSYTNWSETRSLRDEREKTAPVSWARTSSAIILPASSRSENKETFSAHVVNANSKWQTSDHRDEPMGNKIERVSPANTPPSPSVHSPAREAGPSVATLDLSRLNLPPNVRRALAMKYSAKKPSECVTTGSNVVPNLSASRNRFVEAKKEPRALLERLEQPNALSYQPLPPPGPLRAAPIRQQRSISLDSYPSKVGPSSYERPGLVPSSELFPASVYNPTHSPLPKPVNAFSFALNSKQSTLSGKPKMIDLNNAAYLPPRSSPLAKFSSSNQAKESNAIHLEKHGMTELNHTSINKEAVMSKLAIPALRSKIRTMSTERDSAYFRGDSAIYHSKIVHPTLPVSERRPNSAELDRYVVLGSGAVTSSQERIERPVLLPAESRVVFDSKEGNAYRATVAQVRNHIEQNQREATAIALESHFRQSLNPRERASKEHCLVDLGSVDPQQKTLSTRNLHPVESHITVPSHLRKRESTQPSIANINDAVAKHDEHALKRKAAELHEPQLKKRKGLDNSTARGPMSYLPGFEVQELLRLEHQEQSQLKSLHDIQDQIKETKLKLQALSIELENLQSKESKISKEIGHTKNKRLDILQGALHRNNRKSEEASLPSTINSVFTNAKGSEMPSTTSVQSVHRVIPHCGSTDEAPSSTANAHAKHIESKSPQSSLELSKTLTDSNNHIEDLSQTSAPSVKVKTEVVETADTLSTYPNGEKTTPSELSENHTQEKQDTEMGGDAVTRDDVPTRDEQSKCTEEKQVDEHFEKSKKDFLNKIRQELNTPKKRHQMKKNRKKFSEAKISSTIAVSRDKLLLVREKMRGWKVQQDGLDSNTPSTSTDDRPLDQNTPFLSYEETSNFPSSEVPIRDTDSIPKPEKPSSKSRGAASSSRSGSKADSKNKTKVRVVIKKGHSSEVKVNLKKKRKSSHPNKVDDRPASQETLHAEKNTEEQFKDESESPLNVDTEQAKTQGSQFHVAAVESLRKKLEKSNSVKSLSTSKARASSFEGHTGAVCALKVHQGRLYSSSADKTTKAFDIQNGECVKEYLGHHHAVNCLEISPDGDRLFTGSNDQTVRSYNIKTGSCSHKFTFDGRVMCLHIGFGFLYVGLSTGTVTIVDLMTNTCVERLQCHEPRAVSCLATASEGQRSLLCTGSFDATISIRDHKDGLLIKTLNSHTMTVLCIQVVENVIYSGAADCKVLAHNLNTGELLRSYCGQTLSVSGLQVVGRVLVSSCLDKLIRCYDLMSAELLQAYGGQSDMIFSVHVSNGRIYSGGRDGKLTSVKLDLRVYHPCKWKDCQLNFGISSHMKDHLKESHVIQPGTIEKCLWADCGQVFADSEEIETIMDHVLGHVDSKNSNSKN